MSAFLDGRVTHELMLSVWPTADADPDCSEWTAEFAVIRYRRASEAAT